VLITSRERAWSGTAAHIDLDTFTRAESVAFVCQRTGSGDEEATGVTRDQLDPGQAAAWASRALTLITTAFPDHPDDHRTWVAHRQPVCTAWHQPTGSAPAASQRSWPRHQTGGRRWKPNPS
jgi:hypothetical protein